MVNSTQLAEALEAIHSVRQDPGPLLPVLGQVRLGRFVWGEVRDVMGGGNFRADFLSPKNPYGSFESKYQGITSQDQGILGLIFLLRFFFVLSILEPAARRLSPRLTDLV